MEFWKAAPFALTEESGTFYMDWAVNPGVHFGYSGAEVEANVDAILNDSQGWEQAGVVARQVDFDDCKVFFTVVEEAEGESSEAARTFWDETPIEVQLEYQWLNTPNLGWNNLVNHESGHAFFAGTHEGAPGIMNLFTGDRPDWPNSTDIADVADWLEDGGGTDGGGGGASEGTGGVLWFPADLPYYMTRADIPSDAEVCLTATVLQGVEGTRLKGLWGNSREAMVEGRVHDLTAGIPTSEAGFFASEWRPVETPGNLCTGLAVRKRDAGVDESGLVIGLAEVQIRSS